MKKILLVEDTHELAENIADILQNFDYEVQIATNGKVALDILTDYKADLIITDVLMPLMTGLELITQIRKNEKFNSIPIIIFSAKATAGDFELGLKTGANYYLRKPCTAEELMNAVRKLMQS